jgi:hypothetical protein
MEEFDLALEDRLVPDEKRQGYLIKPLFEALKKTLDAKPKDDVVQVTEGDTRNCIVLGVDARTPHPTVLSVIYTAGQAGVRRFWVAAQGRDRAAAFALSLPGIEATDAPKCQESQAIVVPHETKLRIKRGALTPASVDGEPKTGAVSDGAPDTRPILSSKSIPTRDGAQDFGAIRDWLRDTRGKDACETGRVLVKTTDTLSWGAVCTVLGAFTAAEFDPVWAVAE